MSASTETVQQELPPYLAAAYRDAAERALKLSREPYEAYPGRIVAPLAPHTQQALGLSTQIGSHAPYLARAHHHANRGARHFQHHYQEQMQPYQEAVVNNLAGLGQRNFSEGFLPELEKRFAGSGPNAFHPGFSTQARRDMEGEVNSQREDSLARGYQHALQGFELERARELEAARLLKDTGIIHQGSHLADIKSLRESGMISQAQEQALMDQAHEEWKEGKRHPYEKLMEYFGILRGTPYVPSSYVKREVSRPSDIYHHGDWRDIAENVGLNALGGILSGNEPSPAIVAAFKNILPGGERETKSKSETRQQRQQRALAEQKMAEENRQAEREQLKQADIERLYNADIQNFINAEKINNSQGGHFTQSTYELAQQQSLQRAQQKAAQLDAQREAQHKAAQDLERKKKAESEHEASRERKKKADLMTAHNRPTPGPGGGGSKKEGGKKEEDPRWREIIKTTYKLPDVEKKRESESSRTDTPRWGMGTVSNDYDKSMPTASEISNRGSNLDLSIYGKPVTVKQYAGKTWFPSHDKQVRKIIMTKTESGPDAPVYSEGGGWIYFPETEEV